MADTFKFVQAQTTTLAGAGAVIGATSIVLSSLKQIDGTTTLTMTDFGLVGYMTLEPNSGTQEEQISFSGITQNSNGTATLTGVKTVLFVAPYTETSGLAKTHAGGTKVVISNTSAFYNKLNGKDNDETITGLWQFPNDANTPILGNSYVAPTLNNQIASKGYADSLTFSGAPNMSLTQKGIGEEATQAEIDAGTQTGSTAAELIVNPKYLKDSIYYTQLPIAGEKQALVGTSGTPSSSNKFITDNDSTATPTANKVVRYNSTGDVPSTLELASFTLGETVTAGQLLYLKSSDGKAYKASATSVAEALYNYIGIAYEAGNANDVKKVQISGIVTGLSLGATTTSVTSTSVINQSTGGSTIGNIYGGGSTPATLFPTASTQNNIEKIDIDFAANTGVGATDCTLTIYEVTSYASVSTVTVGASLGSKTISITPSATNTFTFASPLTVKPNWHYVAVLSATGGSGANYFNVTTANSQPAKFAVMTNSTTIDLANTNRVFKMQTYKTLTYNYAIGDNIYLGDTAGTTSFVGGTNILPIGKILSSSSILLTENTPRKQIVSSVFYSYGNTSNNILTPRNATSCTVNGYLQTAGTTNYFNVDFNVGDIATKYTQVGDSNGATSVRLDTTASFGGAGNIAFTPTGTGTVTGSTMTVTFYR